MSCSSKGGIIIYLHKIFENVHRLKLNKYATWEGPVREVKNGDMRCSFKVEIYQSFS